jgi:hypothetical protein
MSSNLEFEQAKGIIANVQICQAHLKSTIHNLEMTIHWTSNTTRNLDLLSKFVTAELKRLKAEATEIALKATNNNKNNGFLKFLTGGSSELAQAEESAPEVTESSESVPQVTESSESAPADLEGEIALEGGKILKITEFSLMLRKRSDDFKTIDLLVQTVDLLSIAQSFIINNEKFAFDEATAALDCASNSLVIGEELEKHITNIQFDNSTSKTNTLNNHRVSIQTFNSVIERLPSLLNKLFALSKNLQEDVNDTSELVDQVRKIIISRSSEKESYGILKWFTKQTNDQIKSDMILNAIESVFSSMDRVVFFSTRAFKEVTEIENKVKISLITFSTVPGLHSNKSTKSSSGAGLTALTGGGEGGEEGGPAFSGDENE